MACWSPWQGESEGGVAFRAVDAHNCPWGPPESGVVYSGAPRVGARGPLKAKGIAPHPEVSKGREPSAPNALPGARGIVVPPGELGGSSVRSVDWGIPRTTEPL